MMITSILIEIYPNQISKTNNNPWVKIELSIETTKDKSEELTTS